MSSLGIEVYKVEILRDEISDQVISIEYFDENSREHHREGDEPAVLEFTSGFQQPTSIKYFKHGELHRLGGKPCKQVIDPISKIVYEEQWRENGVPVEGKIFWIERDRQTGVITNAWKRSNGRNVQVVINGRTVSAAKKSLDNSHPSP